MKKLIAVILTLMLICTCSVTVFADEAKYNTAGDLFQYWELNDAYPDYVCGVWSTDGGVTNLAIAVQDTDEGNAGKQEILDLIEDDSTVTFEYREHSYNKLREVQNELFPYFEKNLGLVSTGIYVMSSNVVVGILEEKKDDPATVEMIEEIKSIYGDMIEIEYTGPVVATVYTEPALVNIDEIVNNNITSADCLPLIAVGIILLVFVTIFAFRKKRAMMLQASTGDTVVSTVSLTAKEVENAVKKSTVDVPSCLDEKIFNAINDK